MKIFIAGGTGLIGTKLVEELLLKGNEVTILSRNKEKVRKKWGDKVYPVQGNVLEKGNWQSAISGQEVVINLVGEHVLKRRWTKKRKTKLYDSRILSTKHLIEGIKNCELKPSLYVSPSGTDYYPSDFSKDKHYVETDSSGSSFLANLCIDWELPITELSEIGVRYTILRFGVAFTQTGRGAELMFLPHKMFFGGWVGSGKQPLSWVHIEDMVGSIIWSTESDSRGIFNVVGPEFLTFKQVAKVGGKILHRWTWTWLPGFVLKIILGERASTLLDGRYVSSKKIQDAGYKFRFTTIKDVLEDVL